MTHEPTTTLELDGVLHQRRHRREWIAERWGMALIAVVVAAALSGLLGPGPLSHRTETSSDGQLSINHYALQRYEAPAELVVRFRAPPSGTNLIRLGLSRTLTDRITVEGITPEPESTEMEDGRIVYSFRASNLSGEGQIIVRYKNDEFGSVSYAADLIEGSRVQVAEFVLP
jgi:hypothetical protein